MAAVESLPATQQINGEGRYLTTLGAVWQQTIACLMVVYSRSVSCTGDQRSSTPPMSGWKPRRAAPPARPLLVGHSRRDPATICWSFR